MRHNISYKAVVVLVAAIAGIGCLRLVGGGKKTVERAPSAFTPNLPADRPCTETIISNIDAGRITGYGPLCAPTAPSANVISPLIIEGLNVSPGRRSIALIKDASNQGARVTSGKDHLLIEVSRLVPNTRPDGSPAPEFPPWRQATRINISTQGGRVSGMLACQNFVSGDYQNRLNVAAVHAFGIPSFTTSDGSKLMLEWGLRGRLIISGEPNFARLEVGIAPNGVVAGRAAGGAIFDELVASEDRVGMDEARTALEMKYCMTEKELSNIIVPQLQAGRQPEAP